jgi:uncharacterized protein
LKRCSLVCDTADGPVSVDLQLPDEASIYDALAAARPQLGDASVAWEQATTGIYGKVYPQRFVWRDGDRIEVYRPLQLDPRARRRLRAAPVKGKRL